MKRPSFRWAKLAGTAASLAIVLLGLPAGAAVAATTPSPAAAQLPASLNPGLDISPSAISTSAADLCASSAYKAGFPYNYNVSGYPSIVVATAIAMAESACNPNAINNNSNGTQDQGLWQINTVHGISSSCTFNAMCNAIAAYQLSSGGKNYGPWVTYNNGAWTGFVGAAQAAISRLTVTFFNINTDRCLGADSTSTSNGSPVFQWACSATNPYEQWHILVAGGNLQVLKNVGTGTCLAGDGAASGNGQPVFQWSCSTGGSYEDWILGGSDTLSDYANATLYNWGDGTCLANNSTTVYNGGTIFQWTCDRSNGWMLWT